MSKKGAVTFSFKTTAPLVRKGLENLGRDIPLVSRKRLYDIGRDIKKRMSKPGLPTPYPDPLNWDSPQQRAKFYATNGFGGGIPYVRKGEYESSWVLERLENGYALKNPSKGAIYISGGAKGNRQSKIHAGRWELLRDVFEEETANLPEKILKDLKVVARQEGFKVK
jgi:hypothetical protein